MINSPIASDRSRPQLAAAAFFESPNDDSFTELFRMFTPTSGLLPPVRNPQYGSWRLAHLR
jgi:hypothetical protein